MRSLTRHADVANECSHIRIQISPLLNEYVQYSISSRQSARILFIWAKKSSYPDDSLTQRVSNSPKSLGAMAFPPVPDGTRTEVSSYSVLNVSDIHVEC